MDNYTSCYVVSRALWVDQDNECHLDENAFWSEKSSWTKQLKITKVPEWYIAHINEMKKPYSWAKLDEPPMWSNLEKSYGQVVSFTIEQYCKEYHISPKLFPSTNEEVQITTQNNTTKDIIKSFKTGLTKN
jgi:ubiquitin C-terminal hydrolase